MKDFFVPKDLILFSDIMWMNSDFSVHGFSAGLSEAMATLTVTVSSAAPVADPYWASVLALVQAPEAGSSIVDAKGHTVTLAGNTGVVTTLGTPSIYLDGNGDYARIPYTSDLEWGAGDWTLESIFYPTSVAAGTIFCDAPSFGGFYAVRILLSSGILAVYMYDSSNTEFLVDCGAISANVLHHIAVQRVNGTTLNVYKDGVFVASRSIVSGRSMKAMSAPYTIGAYYSGDYYSGHILAVRKTNGQARYSADFTPPTWPLPVS